ncbi:hypothetical protein AB1K32_07595 [Metabacillus dongyingensis]|uniref:hypothetical protein n=1 Tax=Metabacillus dongyingensis TaxID=2874282 RepID=UPI003B8D67B0
MTAIMDMPLSVIMDFLSHAFDQEKDSSAWELWKALYPFMLMEKLKFMSFDDYKKELFKPKQQFTDITHEEIEREMMEVISAYEGR